MPKGSRSSALYYALFVAEKELDLPWKKGEHYQLTGTWGEEEVALYIDGECVDRNNQLPPAQPTLIAEVFTLNNDTAVDTLEIQRIAFCGIGRFSTTR